MFLKSQVEDREKQFMSGQFVSDVWKALVARHEQQGPITQVGLIQDLLLISYPVDLAACPAISDKIRDLVDHIFMIVFTPI